MSEVLEKGGVNRLTLSCHSSVNVSNLGYIVEVSDNLTFTPASGSGYYWDLSNFTINGAIAPVPEPSRVLLLCAGFAVLTLRRLQWGDRPSHRARPRSGSSRLFPPPSLAIKLNEASD